MKRRQMRIPRIALFLSLLTGAVPSGAAVSCAHLFRDQTDLSSTLPGEYEFHLERLRKFRESRLADTPARRAYLLKMKQKTASALIVDSLALAAKRLDEVIVVRPINPATLAFLERNFAPKPLSLKSKTSRKGLTAGLVVRDFSVATERLIQEGHLTVRHLESRDGVAVIRGEKEVWTKEPRPTDRKIEVLADSQGRIITADADVLMFLRRVDPSRQPVSEDPRYGFVSEADRTSIQTINRKFRELDRREKKRDLVQHGPENQNPRTSAVDYPLMAFTPQGTLVHIEEGPAGRKDQNLTVFLNEWKRKGYRFSLPANWNLKFESLSFSELP